MIKSRLCELIGTRYPIIQAGMGPFSNNNLGIAAARAGVLGLFSTSGLTQKDLAPYIYQEWIRTAEAGPDDDMPKVEDMVQNIVNEAEGILRGVQEKFLR